VHQQAAKVVMVTHQKCHLVKQLRVAQFPEAEPLQFAVYLSDLLDGWHYLPS
jgi:hypothetical protein